MLLWITVIVLIFFILLWFIANKQDWGTIEFISIGITAMAAAICVFMILALIISHVGNDGYVASSHQRYDSLVYQVKNRLYEDDILLSKKELANQITEWNEDLAKHKINQDDFWIGIFVPNVYDQFEFIPIELIGQ